MCKTETQSESTEHHKKVSGNDWDFFTLAGTSLATKIPRHVPTSSHEKPDASEVSCKRNNNNNYNKPFNDEIMENVFLDEATTEFRGWVGVCLLRFPGEHSVINRRN